jgi:hypothetical protein
LLTTLMVWRADCVRLIRPRNVWRCDSAAELGRREGYREVGSRPGPCPLLGSLRGRSQKVPDALVDVVPSLGSAVSLRRLRLATWHPFPSSTIGRALPRDGGKFAGKGHSGMPASRSAPRYRFKNQVGYALRRPTAPTRSVGAISSRRHAAALASSSLPRSARLATRPRWLPSHAGIRATAF